MFRFTDQYLWHLVFGLFYLALLVMGMIILSSEAHLVVTDLTIVDLLLITLASWRLVRLFVYDSTTKWLREQFYDVHRTKQGVELVPPATGPRRTLVDLFTCPWCFGVWTASMVSFSYLLTPLAYVPVLILAVAALASYLQIIANLTDSLAEQAKQKSGRGF